MAENEAEAEKHASNKLSRPPSAASDEVELDIQHLKVDSDVARLLQEVSKNDITAVLREAYLSKITQVGAST
jgi:hypothetical protein